MSSQSTKPEYDAPYQDSVLGPVEDLLDLAMGMLDGSSTRFRYHRDGDPSIEEVRDALGLQHRWGFWRAGKWRRIGSVNQQRRFTNVLLDFFSGTLTDKHFTDPGNYGVRSFRNRKEEAAEIFNFLQVNRPEQLKQAVEGLTSYSAYLVKISSAKRIGVSYPSQAELGSNLHRTDSSVIPFHVNGGSYSGTQQNFSDPRTRVIFRCLNEAIDSQGNPDAPKSLSSLDFELRPYSVGQAILNQKLALYGGIPISGLTPLGFAALKLTFARSLSNQVYSAITDNSQAFSSHTIVAPPGQGKSIALAQVLLRLCETPGYWTFWSLDCTRSFACEASHRSVEKYFSLFRDLACAPRKIVFIFDDMQRRSAADYEAIYGFHSWCEHYRSERAIDISFLCSSTDPRQSMSPERNTLPLRLDLDDENRLYEILTEAQPIIVKKNYDTLDDLLVVQPGKDDWKDDVQSLTDFIVQHSRPIREFAPGWFSDLKDETPLAQRILPTIAVSQLLDLPLPEHITYHIAGLDEEDFNQSKTTLLSSSHRISHVVAGGDERIDAWSGYELRAPYYARSLLRRLGRLERSFIKQAISQILECSLARAEQDFFLWSATDAEFVRHVFQRVAKRKFGRLAGITDGDRIADEIFQQHGAKIAHILKSQRAIVNCARWAGTFSYLLPQKAGGSLGSETHTVEHVVFDLCSHVLTEAQLVASSRDFVPLMWTLRALCLRFGSEAEVRNLATAAQERINLEGVIRSVTTARDPEWQRRANEVLLSYVKFLMAVPGRTKSEISRDVFKTYNQIERKFCPQLRFDAGNWIQRADVVLIRNEHDVGLRGYYLAQARQVIMAQVRQQAKWKSDLDDRIINFERRYRQSVDSFTNRPRSVTRQGAAK
jgi:hypothetical protein